MNPNLNTVEPQEQTLKRGVFESSDLLAATKEQLESVWSAAEDMHMEINEARGWNMKPSGAERESWARTLDKAKDFLESLKPRCPHCDGTHPIGCCAQDGHGG